MGSQEIPVSRKPLRTDGGTSVDGSERTRVGHCKRDETDVYAGRGPDGRNMLGSHVGQRGWLGNPHRVDENGRELSIEKFRIDFEQKLARDPTFAAAIADLSGKTLGCWCQRFDEDEPACHAEIIAEHADRLARELHQQRRARYDELAEQIKGEWGEKALAWCDGGEVLDYYAEMESGQLVCAWPDYLDEPVLKIHHHQTLANHIRQEQSNESVELRIVEWGETPFPDDERGWPLI